MAETDRTQTAEASIFALLSPEQAQAVQAMSVARKVKKGEAVLEQGEIGASLVLIKTGTFKICSYASSGREIVLGYLGPGQVAGELSLFDEQPRAASVIAMEAGEAQVLQRRDVMAAIARDPDIARRIIRVLCARLRRTNQLIESERSSGMGPRLARGLLRLLEDHGAMEGDALRLRLPISQGDLGGYVSLSRENVNRQLQEWQQAGIVERRDGGLVVLDLPALEEIAAFED